MIRALSRRIAPPLARIPPSRPLSALPSDKADVPLSSHGNVLGGESITEGAKVRFQLS